MLKFLWLPCARRPRPSRWRAAARCPWQTWRYRPSGRSFRAGFTLYMATIIEIYSVKPVGGACRATPSVPPRLRPAFDPPLRAEQAAAFIRLSRLPSSQYHSTRPLAPPYSLHTFLLKVESYNDIIVRLSRLLSSPQEQRARCQGGRGAGARGARRK